MKYLKLEAPSGTVVFIAEQSLALFGHDAHRLFSITPQGLQTACIPPGSIASVVEMSADDIATMINTTGVTPEEAEKVKEGMDAMREKDGDTVPAPVRAFMEKMRGFGIEMGKPIRIDEDGNPVESLDIFAEKKKTH